MTLRIFASICALLLAVSTAFAQQPQRHAADTVRQSRVRGVQYASPQEAAAALAAAERMPLWAGGSVSVNLAGAALALYTPYG